MATKCTSVNGSIKTNSSLGMYIHRLFSHIHRGVSHTNFKYRYNIAPRSNAPVIRRQDTSQQGSSSTSTEQVVMQTMKWGLVPHWSKHEDKTLNTTNARSENLVEGGGMWRSLKGRKRCVVACQG